MDVFNKLKSAVSNVLPGNPLSRDFDIYHQVASAGPGLLWKVYSATKKSTKEEASIFLFEKKSTERYSRRDRDAILEMLRGGVQQLTKLRHPKILAVIHPLEESRETLAYATEPVFASLANVLGNLTAVPTVPKDLQEYQLYDVEIKHGLLQLTEAVAFLHNGAKMMHRNLCPEAIILTKMGAWKLAGCDFCLRSSDPQATEPSYPFQELRSSAAPVTQPNLDFLAPEYVLTMVCGPASDMFSVGLLIYAIFAKGKTLFQCDGELSAFKDNAEELRHLRVSLLGAVPDELREHVKLLLNTEPTVRPDAAQLSKVPFFEDMGCVTLQFMDTLFQRQNMEKSNFFKGLPKIIAKLPKRVSLQRILPALFKETVNPDMVPFLLPSILLVAGQATEMEYKLQVFPHLIPVFKLKEPIQVVLLLLQNMNLLLSKTPKGDIQNHVLPMLFRAVEADSPQIQELCLSIIPTFADLIEYPTLKNSLVPRIKKLCLATTVLTVRVNCLLCLGQLLEHMDKWFVLDEILPFLHKIPTREPAVLMSILGIHQVAFEGSKLGITKDMLSNKVLPFLIPIAMDNNLNLSQFNAFMTLIRDMLSKMETEHRGKLEQLDQMKQEQRSLEISRITGSEGDLVPEAVTSTNKNSTMMDKFLSGFGLSGFMSSQPQKAGGGGGGSVTGSPLAGAGTVSPSGIGSSPAGSAPVVPPPSKKTNLTLEEKQRLAKQQEQQQILKSQSSITPSSKTASSTSRPASGGGGGGASKPRGGATKDLTSTLMQSNMNAMTSMTVGQIKPPQSSYNTNTNTWGSGPTWSSSTTSMGMSGGGGGGGAGFGGSPMSGMGYSQQGSPFGMQQAGAGFGSPGMNSMRTGGQQAKPDLSAFDSLMDSSQKAKVPMNQMGAARPTGFHQPQPMGMMTMNPMSSSSMPMGMAGNSMGMAGNSMGMAGNSMGMTGNPMGMGMNSNRMGSPMMSMPVQQSGFGSGGATVGQMGVGGMQGQSGGQMLTPTGSMMPSQKSSTNSLDDLLG